MGEELKEDERFSRILSDPHFRKTPKNVRKVALDKRMKKIFKDSNFKAKCELDKRGRLLNLTPTENLKKLYDMASESSDEEEDGEYIDKNNIVNKNEYKKSENSHKKTASIVKKSSKKDTSEESDDSDDSESSDNMEDEVNETLKERGRAEKGNLLAENSGKSKKANIEDPEKRKSYEKNKKANIQKSKKDSEKSKKDSVKKKKANIEKNEEDSEESTSEESDDSDDSESSDSMEDEGRAEKGNLLAEDSEKSKKANIQKSKKDSLKSKKDSVKNKKADIEKNEDSEESSSEESDDSDSESDDSSGNQSEDFDHKWEELRGEAPDTNEIHRRLAVCNMDWDRIKAADLLVCFHSFKPADGCINSVKIYPSEYGLKRMEEEKLKGPRELVEQTLDEELQDKKGSKYHREKLRMYQINRLKYYYAVVECDSPETANVLYEQLNGMEYESSSVRFDLRFIPDDVTFDHEPTSVADNLPDPTEYQPSCFVTSALQQVKVNLTWDETSPKRREFFKKIFTDPDTVQNDIHDYLASATSESEEENISDEEQNENMKTKDRIAKYKELLLSIEEQEKEELEERRKKYDVEYIWNPELKEKAEEQVQEKIKTANMNPFEEMLHKKKEEKKKKKKEQKAIQAEDSDSSEAEFFGDASASDRKTKDEKRLAELALISDSKKEIDVEEKPRKKNKKNKSRDLDDFVGNPNDPRFAAMYTSSLFNMVPSNPHIKKNEGKFTGKSDKRKFKSKKFHESRKKIKH